MKRLIVVLSLVALAVGGCAASATDDARNDSATSQEKNKPGY